VTPARTPESERIAARAYSIWEEEGRPHGRDRLHWERAERELAGTQHPPADRAAPEPAPLAAEKPARRAAPSSKPAGPSPDAPATPARGRKAVAPVEGAAPAAAAEPPAAPARRSRAKPAAS
jgi:hypothetical protein